MKPRRFCLLSLATVLLATAVPAQTPPHKSAAAKSDFPEVKPEAVGFSSQRLERLHAVLQKRVNDKQMPGMVTLLARHGKIVDFQTYGNKDLAAGTPME